MVALTDSQLISTTEQPPLEQFLPGFLDSLTKDEKILVLCVLGSIALLICVATGTFIRICSTPRQNKPLKSRKKDNFVYHYPLRYEQSDRQKLRIKNELPDTEESGEGPFTVNLTSGYLPRSYIAAPVQKKTYSRRYRTNTKNSLSLKEKRRKRKRKRPKENSFDRRRENAVSYYQEPTTPNYTTAYDWLALSQESADALHHASDARTDK